MSTQPFNPPTPVFNNPPPVPEFFEPRRFTISAITNAAQAQVTTALDNNYVIGQLLRFIIPPTFGMTQISNQLAYVLSIQSTTQFTTDANTSFYDSFVASPSFTGGNSPQVLAIGDVNSGTINSSGRVNLGTTIPGAFQNTSPVRT